MSGRMTLWTRSSVCTYQLLRVSEPFSTTQARIGMNKPWTIRGDVPRCQYPLRAKLWPMCSCTASVIGRSWQRWCERPASRQTSAATCCSARHFARTWRRWAATLQLLKTRSAQYRPALRRLEGYGRRLAALRASRTRLRAHARIARTALGLALLAALGIVDKLFVVEKDLFACGEHELGAAINTLQDTIGELHGRLPQRRD